MVSLDKEILTRESEWIVGRKGKGEPVVSYWVLGTVKVASRSGKHSKRKTPLGYHAYDHSISIMHVCPLEALNMNIDYFVSAET